MKSDENLQSFLERTDIPKELKIFLEKQISTNDQLREEIRELKVKISASRQQQDETNTIIDQVEEAVRAEQEKFHLLMDNIPHHVFWKDLDSKYLGCNMHYARAVGLDKPEDIIGKQESDLHWTDDEVRSFLESDRRIIETGKPELPTILQVIRIDGSLGIYEVNKVPLLDGRGNITGTLGTSQDISDRVRLENLLKQTKLEEERYHSMMGHFNRNDLQKIIAYLEYLENTYKIENKLDLTSVATVKEIVSQSSIVIETVDKIFDVIKTPPFSLRRSTYQNVKRLLDMSVSGLVRSKRKPINITIDQQSLDMNLASDKYLIDIFNELLSYIVISGESEQVIEVLASRTYQGFAITIQDNRSNPIKEEISSLLTGKITDKWEYQGHYIGISYVSVLMKYYRGSLKIVPIKPSGNRFVLTFPNSLLESSKQIQI